jgi:hypothetical protein
VTGRYVVGPDLNFNGTATIVRDKYGKVVGWWLDDTTPNDPEVIASLVQAALEQGLLLFCLVAPGQLGQRHRPSPPCVNILEAYWKGIYSMSLLKFFTEFLKPKRYRYAGYIMQRNYGFQDVGGGPRDIPSPRQYRIMRRLLTALHSEYGLWDF